MPFVLDFSSANVSLDAAGGKGANLAKLWSAGLPVPPGFIVVTEAYRAFVGANGLQEKIVALANAAVPDDPVSLDTASLGIRTLFATGEMPAEVAAGIAAAYKKLSAGAALPVAVRSSATAEDLPGMSFAGQQDTYLNVIGAAAVLAAVRDCWASLWTARALGYRARNGISPVDVSLAVVVQALVPAEAAGVLFTANPVTGRRDEMVIDASLGLGEAVVSGQVEPDHYVVRRKAGGQAWTLVERQLGAKATVTLPVQGGGIRHEETQAGERQALPDDQIVTLARLSEQVAGLMGSPQDIEWAWAAGTLHLLQSRPITALYPLPASADPAGELRVYFSLNAVQGIAEPLTPFSLGLFRLIADGLARFLKVPGGAGDALTTPGSRIYADITPVAADAGMRRILMAILRRGDPVAFQVVSRLLREGRITERQTHFPGKLPRRRVFIHVLSTALFPGRGVPAVMRRVEGYLEAARGRLGSRTDLDGLMRSLEAELPRLFPEVVLAIGPFIALGLAIVNQVDGLLMRWLGEPAGASLRLLRGIPGNVTTAMDLKLWEVARGISADDAARQAFLALSPADAAIAYKDGKLPPAAQEGVAGFLREYGMRGAGEVDLGRPRWADDPGVILQTIANYLALDDPLQAPDAVFARGARESADLLAEYQARLRRKRFGFIKAHFLGEAVRRMRLLTAMRESPKYAIIRFFYPYRTGLQRQGESLAARGLLDRADDIFYLSFDLVKRLGEAQAQGTREDVTALGASLREAARAGHAEYDREAARPRSPRILLSTGEAFNEALAEPATAGELTGDPVSPGVAEGVVRVVLDPRGVRLIPGEILVCLGTDPGWTPLFLTAGGLIMEMGGMVTHGAVVAREYGLPAVVGVRQATTVLKTGQRVRLDGSAGRVTLLD